MSKLKFIPVAIAPLVLGWGVWSFISSSGSPLPDELVYVDVFTGQQVKLNRDRIKSIPARNSQGERSLFPAYVGKDGKLYLHERYKDSLESFKNDQRLKVDLQTLAVTGG